MNIINNLITEKYQAIYSKGNHLNDDEPFARVIFDLIVQKVKGQLEYEDGNALFQDEYFNYDLLNADNEDEFNQISDEDEFKPESSNKRSIVNTLLDQYSISTMKNIVSCSSGNNGLARTFKRYPSLNKSHEKLARIRSFVKNEGNRSSQLIEMKKKLYERFTQSRGNLASIHDWTLQLWAMEISKDIGLTNFKSSKTFISTFKKQFHIHSRKITLFYTHKINQNEAVLKATATEFVKNANLEISVNQVHPRMVWNTDQSGLNYEMVGNRTLSHIGEKTTVGLCQSVNSTTHSYTVQVCNFIFFLTIIHD